MHQINTTLRVLKDILENRPPRPLDVTMLQAFGGHLPANLSLDQYACALLEFVIHTRRKDDPRIRITEREAEVLTLLAIGKSTKEIAHELGITFKTAACHRQHLMDKLDAHSVVLLVHHAIRRGLVRA